LSPEQSPRNLTFWPVRTPVFTHTYSSLEPLNQGSNLVSSGIMQIAMHRCAGIACMHNFRLRLELYLELVYNELVLCNSALLLGGMRASGAADAAGAVMPAAAGGVCLQIPAIRSSAAGVKVDMDWLKAVSSMQISGSS